MQSVVNIARSGRLDVCPSLRIFVHEYPAWRGQLVNDERMPQFFIEIRGNRAF